MFERQKQRERVRAWARSTNSTNRKDAQKALPDIPAKVIRQVLQSVKDMTTNEQRSE